MKDVFFKFLPVGNNHPQNVKYLCNKKLITVF